MNLKAHRPKRYHNKIKIHGMEHAFFRNNIPNYQLDNKAVFHWLCHF